MEGPYTVRYDKDHDRILVWEMGDPDVLRLFDNNFTNMTVLDLPIPGYDIKGVEFDDGGVRVIAWGRSPGSTNDSLAVYWTSNHTLDLGFAPDGTLPPLTMDAVRSFASNLILAIGGRDANGTSRIMVIELASGWVLTDDPIAGNRTVVDIGSDGHSMIVLDDGGRVAVYQTGSWTVKTMVQLFDGPFITHSIMPGRKWVFSGEGGHAIAWRYDSGGGIKGINVSGGPIEGGVAVSVPYHDAVLVSVPVEMGGSNLQIWIMNITWEYELAAVIPLEGSVATIVGDPTAADRLTVCFDDGSIRRFQYTVEEMPPDEREFNIDVQYWLPFAVAAIVLLYWHRRRKRQ